MAITKYFRFRMERPHQFGFGTWADAIRVAREIEDTYGVDVMIDELQDADARRMERDEDRHFFDLRDRKWERYAARQAEKLGSNERLARGWIA